MTSTQVLVHGIFAASSSSKSSSNPLVTVLPLVAIGLLAYFFFIRPQQRKAQAARQAQGGGIEAGDEVQTVGGIIGTVLEVHGDRYTLLTGALGEDGNLDGPQPTRIVVVRQAIARKIDRIEDVRTGGGAADGDDTGDAAGESGPATGATPGGTAGGDLESEPGEGHQAGEAEEG